MKPPNCRLDGKEMKGAALIITTIFNQGRILALESSVTNYQERRRKMKSWRPREIVWGEETVPFHFIIINVLLLLWVCACQWICDLSADENHSTRVKVCCLVSHLLISHLSPGGFISGLKPNYWFCSQRQGRLESNHPDSQGKGSTEHPGYPLMAQAYSCPAMYHQDVEL